MPDRHRRNQLPEAPLPGNHLAPVPAAVIWHQSVINHAHLPLQLPHPRPCLTVSLNSLSSISSSVRLWASSFFGCTCRIRESIPLTRLTNLDLRLPLFENATQHPHRQIIGAMHQREIIVSPLMPYIYALPSTPLHSFPAIFFYSLCFSMQGPVNHP